MEVEKQCIHHFLIGETDRDVMKGVCKKCGLVRFFPAVFQYDVRGNVITATELVKNCESSNIPEG